MKIKIDNINFAYNKNIDVLKNVSFNLYDKDICCVLGRNGSGKTTLIKCLNGVLSPYSGSIYLDGKKLNTLKRKDIARYISFIPQEHKLSFNYEVIDIVTMGRFSYIPLFSKPKEEDYLCALQSLKDLDIGHLAYKNYNELSGGEKQLVLIARALTQNPKLFLFDEPTSHLDFKNQHHILNSIKKLVKKNNVSIFMSMHDPNLALKFCDKFIILKDGEVYNSGLAKDVVNEETLSTIYDMKVYIRNLDKDIKIILPDMN